MADRSISYAFRANFAQFKAQLSAASEGVRDFGNDLTGLDQQGEDLRDSLGEIADQVAVVGAVAGSAFAAAVVTSANFEQSLSAVRAVTGETAENMERLGQAALDAGAETVFSASEAAAAIENLAKAGVSTEDILGGALGGALDLAAAGQLEVADAAEFTATALTQFALSGDQATHVADLLAAGAGKAQGEVADMANALNYAGVPAANLGVSIEETAAAIALLAKNGIIGEQAGTSLRGMLASLTSPSAIAKREMDGLGISVFDAQGKFIGFEGVAGQLQQRLGGLTDAERANSLGRIFGNEQLQAANVLYREGAAGVQEWKRNVDDAGYASEAAGIQLDNLKGDVEGLKGAFETALIGTGSGQQGILRDLTQSATNLINTYNRLPGPVKTATGALLGITAITAGGFWLSTKAVASIATTRAALQGLGLQAATTRQMLATLGGGAAAFTAVAATLFDTLSQYDTWERSRAAAKATADSFEELAEALKDSNVGKYAADLDIDLQKLAEDLYQNGASGEYATKVMGELDKASSGFGDNAELLAGDILPFLTTGANKAWEAHDDLNNILDGSKDVLGSASEEARKAAIEETNLSGAALDLAESSGASAEEVKALADALAKAREQATGAVDSFLNLSAGVNDGKFSFKEWLTALREAGNAVRDFRKNADRAEGRGLDSGLINELQLMGEEGALQLAYFAKATDRELEQANRAWRRWGRQSTATIDEVSNDIAGIPAPEITPSLDINPFARGIAWAKGEVSGLDGESATPKADLNLRPFKAALGGLNAALTQTDRKGVKPTVNLLGVPGAEDQLRNLVRPRTVSVTPTVSGSLKAIFGGSADGSTVPKDGGSYRDRYPYLLAPGEEVISNRHGQADRHRGLLKAINAGRLADGGTVRGLAGGGTVSALGFAGLPGLSLAAMGLKALNSALRDSQKSLEKETAQRDAVAESLSSLRGEVTSKGRSDLFGETDVWASADSGFAAAMATLAADSAAAKALKADIAALKSKGLNGAALDDLLRNADAATVDMFAGQSKADLARFEAAYNTRQSLTASAGSAAGQAAYGAELARQTTEMKLVAARVARVEAAIKSESAKSRKSTKRGASSGSRSTRRG